MNTSKHESFYIDTVTFLVEDCLFKVPRHPLETESRVFGDMFLLPIGDLDKVEGLSDENPIRLMDTKKDEFEQLLNVLFHRTHGESQKLPTNYDQWASVLKLSTIWGFPNLRKAAIKRLRDMPPADQIFLGYAYDLDFESWMLPAMHKIVRRPEPISVEEARRMGLESALKLASVREQIAVRAGHNVNSVLVAGPRVDVSSLDFTQILRTTFSGHFSED